MHADAPSISFQMSAVQLSPAAANTFAVEETSFSLGFVDIKVPKEELRYIYHQSSSSKTRARHSLLRILIWLHFQN
jgi:hypothetical protein